MSWDVLLADLVKCGSQLLMFGCCFEVKHLMEEVQFGCALLNVNMDARTCATLVKKNCGDDLEAKPAHRFG